MRKLILTDKTEANPWLSFFVFSFICGIHEFKYAMIVILPGRTLYEQENFFCCIDVLSRRVSERALERLGDLKPADDVRFTTIFRQYLQAGEALLPCLTCLFFEREDVIS